MSKQKFRVYLAGPISGCNDHQKHKWREEIKQRFAADMDFIDPTETLKSTSYAAVKNDIDSVEAADGLLVNMWRESIGSAIGIVHAHRNGRPVAVADPNHMNNTTLKFYATVIQDTPVHAANMLLRILRANADWTVIKAGRRDDEEFNREKLVTAIRAACTRRNSIVVPVLLLPRIIERLTDSDHKLGKQLPTKLINDAVLASLKELEGEPDYAPAVKGVAEAWQRRREAKRASPLGRSVRRPTPTMRDEVVIASNAAHATIWGKSAKGLSDIPSPDARKAFQAVWEVAGITRIVLGQFGHREERATVGIWVGASKQSAVIEGKLYDKGEKGTLQTFQVRTQHARHTTSVLRNIISKLKAAGYWAG